MKENSKHTELQSFTAVCQKFKKNPYYCWNISLVDCLCFRLAKESEGRGGAEGGRLTVGQGGGIDLSSWRMGVGEYYAAHECNNSLHCTADASTRCTLHPDLLAGSASPLQHLHSDTIPLLCCSNQELIFGETELASYLLQTIKTHFIS